MVVPKGTPTPYPPHIYLEFKISATTRTTAAYTTLDYCGDRALTLCNCIGGALWHAFCEYSDIKATSRQEFYNLAREGAVCVAITLPPVNDPLFRAHSDKWLKTLAETVALWAHQSTPLAGLAKTGEVQARIVRFKPQRLEAYYD